MKRISLNIRTENHHDKSWKCRKQLKSHILNTLPFLYPPPPLLVFNFHIPKKQFGGFPLSLFVPSFAHRTPLDHPSDKQTHINLENQPRELGRP